MTDSNDVSCPRGAAARARTATRGNISESSDRSEPHISAPLRASLARHIGYWLAAGVVVFVGMTALLWWILGAPGFAGPNGLKRQGGLDLIKIALTLTGGVGGVIFLVVAYRKQRLGEMAERRENTTSRREDIKLLSERFMNAAGQLGDVTPTVRLAGVYAMADLADEWLERRQTCIDMLSAYVRMHYDPTPPDDPADRQHWHGERQVRQTIFRVMASHLREDADTSWQGYHFDFTGAVIDGADFHEIRVSGGVVTFKGAEFPCGKIEFDGSIFSGGTVDFSNAIFSGGELNFGCAKFTGTVSHFFEAELEAGSLDFSYAHFIGGTVNFDSMRPMGGTLSFHSAVFSGANVGFGCSEFDGTYVDFRQAKFLGGNLAFGDCEFLRGRVDFSRAEFAGGYVGIRRSKYNGGTLDMSHPQSWETRPVIDTRNGEGIPAGLLLPVGVEE